MLESGKSESYWAVQKAEAIIKTHAQIQKFGNIPGDFPEKHPFLSGFIAGSLLTAAVLFNFRQPKSK